MPDCPRGLGSEYPTPCPNQDGSVMGTSDAGAPCMCPEHAFAHAWGFGSLQKEGWKKQAFSLVVWRRIISITAGVFVGGLDAL